MINTDKHIRDIFSQKLHDIEADVPDGLWESISQQLPDATQVANTGSSAGATSKIGFSMTKLWVAMGIAASVVTGVVWLNSNTEIELKGDQTAVAKTQDITPSLTNPVESSQPQGEMQTPANSSDQVIVANSKVDQKVNADKSSDSDNNIVAVYERTHNDSDQQDSKQQLSPEAAHSEPGAGDSQTDLNSGADPVIDQSSVNVTPNARFSVVTVSESDLEYQFVPDEKYAASYSWSINGTKTSSEQIFSKRFLDEGEYLVQLTVGYKDGTTITKETNVRAVKPPDFFIPNVFTPNGDGRNDTFDPQSRSNNISIIKVVILDNKGKVFESDSAAHWDGRDMAGNECVTGNYYYLIRAVDQSGQIIEKTGSVRLIRN